VNPLLRDILLIVEVLCWPVCFWWMHRISVRQNVVLKQLGEQASRIEHVSTEEHQILKELHPVVQKIEEKVVNDDPDAASK
jgi:Holliday junction resolvasome RuvABC endonuclease subunit